MTVRVREAAGAVGALTGSRMEITLITPGWGSSGYYSAEVLEAAVQNRVFPRNTQQHIDHMDEATRQKNPAGSVATLAAALKEDARWEPDWLDEATGVKGRIVAETRVFGHWRETLADMKEAIGVSISAGAVVSPGEAEGRRGNIVESLLPGALNRVDFVTVAGRGGRITEVLESRRVEEAHNIGMWLESRLHTSFTLISDEMFGDGRLTREERIVLSSALGDALTSFTANVESNAPQLFERGMWEDPTPTAVEAAKDSLPNPARANERKGSTVTTIQIEEAEHRNLVENSSRVTALEAERDTTRATLSEANTEAAAVIVNAALEAANLTAPKTAARLISSAPVKENGALDASALATEISESIAEMQSANGVGSVRTVGESTTAPSAPAGELTSAQARESILAVRGYTPKGAK